MSRVGQQLKVYSFHWSKYCSCIVMLRHTVKWLFFFFTRNSARTIEIKLK